MEDINKRIKEIEDRLCQLPKGTLVYKTINGKKQPYLQQTINGKTKSVYVNKSSKDRILLELNEREELKKELDYLKCNGNYNIKNNIKTNISFKTIIKLDQELNQFINTVSNYKKRNCFNEIINYLYNDNYSRVLILYGLRRTGKTTLIKQAILDMNINNRSKSAYIQINYSNTLADLNYDLKILNDKGYKYIFIDEVTLMNDFIDGASLLSDIFVPSGMKIVLSGTDSLGFWISLQEQLYDRTNMIHTTFISYNEFKNVLGIEGIDNYICYGGTMSVSGNHYNENYLFSSENDIDEYVDSAIAKNIQHSLKCYQNESHFRNLEELYLKNELTSAINRVVEDINHRFLVSVLTKDFISHDLRLSANNPRKDRSNPNDILDRVDTKTITNRLKQALEILNMNEQKVKIEERHEIEIKEYLYALDLIEDIDIDFIPVKNNNAKITVVSQPGLRYSQAKILIEKLMLDEIFQDISAIDRKNIIDRILNEVKGRMMEEIVLLETKIAKKDKRVFKLQFSAGEFDMVVVDNENVTCEIYEIKHSDKIVLEQQRHLLDVDKCNATEFRYGKILNKYVIYRGENIVLDNGIIYLNVEEYLDKLY